MRNTDKTSSFVQEQKQAPHNEKLEFAATSDGYAH